MVGSTNNTKIACFDVDDTLICGQSQKLFLIYLYQHRYISFVQYIRTLSWFLGYKMGFFKNPEKIMEYAYRGVAGRTREEVDIIVSDFFSSTLSKYFFPVVVQKLRKHQAEGDTVVLVSNSTNIIIERVAKSLDIVDYFATKLEEKEGVFTGCIAGEIMYGKNKVKALNNYREEKNLTRAEIFAYTDHISDLSLLERANVKFVVNPRKKLREIARQQGWEIIDATL
jgi:HAD superfamily hydrolase (TIGR01490 family)